MSELDSLALPEAILPHRPPFLYLDEILSCQGQQIVARRFFPASEPFFQGHFPTRPVVPGVILIEGMAQALGYWALCKHPKHWVLLTGVDSAKFTQVVAPESDVIFRVEVLKARRGLVIAQGQCHVADQQVAQAQIKGYLQARDDI